MPLTHHLDDSQTGDYFALSRRDVPMAVEQRQLRNYIAAFKHALLFTPRLLFADHMIVNSPNFRRAYQQDPAIRECFALRLAEVAHFEMNKNGSHMTLCEMRDFYRRGEGLFHPHLPLHFTSGQFDHELEDIERSARRHYPESKDRDPLFTSYCKDLLEHSRIKSILGEAHTAFAVAHAHMLERYPTLGIIHFDYEHTFRGDENIFDYMSHLNGVRASKQTLVRTYGQEIARIYRALLIRAETKLLMGSIVLPSDLRDYRTFVLHSADRETMHKDEREEREVEIDMSPVSVNAMASLTSKQLIEYRNSDEANNFFKLLRECSDLSTSFDQLVSAVRVYCLFLNKRLSASREQLVERIKKGSIRVIRGVARNLSRQVTGVNVIVDILGLFSQSIYAFNPAGILKGAGKDIAKPLAESLHKASIGEGIRASLVQYAYPTEGRRERITQYL